MISFAAVHLRCCYGKLLNAEGTRLWNQRPTPVRLRCSGMSIWFLADFSAVKVLLEVTSRIAYD